MPAARKGTLCARSAEALLTAGSAFGRLSPLTVDEGAGMTERSYEQLQARAVNNLENSYGDEDGSSGQAASLARAQAYSLLAFGSAIRDLAKAMREAR